VPQLVSVYEKSFGLDQLRTWQALASSCLLLAPGLNLDRVLAVLGGKPLRARLGEPPPHRRDCE